MLSENSESHECTECGYVFQGDELSQDLRERKPCPSCGSLRRLKRFTHRESLSLNEYIGLKAKKPSSKHHNNRADYEFEEGKKKGGDGRLVYKKLVKDREHSDSDNSYQELVIDVETGKGIVNKHEKLSKHTSE